MAIDDIIKRYKDHLTKAQISELIQATERYKQLNAANRASAINTLSKQYRATRRGLQNMGLAGRQGKMISGQEKAARIRANEAYKEYDKQLGRVEGAYAENAAVRMANETIQRRNAEAERRRKAAEEAFKQQQEELARRQAEARQNQNDRIYDRLHPNAPFTRSDRMTQYEEQTVPQQVRTRNDVITQRREDLRIRQNDAMRDRLNPNGIQRQQMQYEDVRAEQKRQENANQMKVGGASNDEIWFADAYGVSADRYNTVKRENPELIKELTGAIQDLRTKNYDTVINTQGNIYDKHQAREDKAKAESAISKAAVAMGIDDAEMRNLYLMNDTQFAVAFAAADALAAARQKHDSSDAIQDQMMMSGKSGAFNSATRDAEARLAKFDQVRRLRYDTADKTLYYDTYPTDVQTKDAKTVRSFCAINQNTTPYAWANPKNENGENWYQAAQNGWKAENDGNTKYGALVNDWSLVGGRQGMRYQQTGKVMALLANVMPHFYDLADETGTYSNAFEDTHVQSWAVHNGISTADYYDYVRNSCVKAFYGNNASHEDYEQMDAMLALANLMTDEERARFNELANGSYGAFANEADEYFEYLYKNVLPERFKAYVDELNGVFTDTTYGKIGQSALSVLTNLGEGITGPIHTLTTNYNDSVSAQLGAMKYTTAQAARESVSKDFSPVGKFFYDTGMSMADSATVGMISGGIGKVLQGAGVGVKLATKAGSVLGGSILGGSAFNSAYKEALDRGLSPDKARTVAVGQGFNEMLFESLSLDLLVSQFQKGGILKVSKNGFVNWVVNTLVQGGVEGSEEVFTDIANSLWDKEINGIYSEELTKLREYISNGMSYEDAKRKVDAEYAEQLGMSFLGGFVSGGVMGGGATFMGMMQNRGNEKLGAGLRQNERVVNELRNFDFKSEYAQEILTQDKLTNQDVADLFNIRQQELLGQYESDIQQAVDDGKITQEQADLLKKYEQNGVQIVHDGEVVANENGITNEQMVTVQDAIANLDNAARIQFLNNEEMRLLVQAVGGETAAVIEQSETAERESEQAYRQTVREINNDTTLSPELKQKRLEAAERTRQNARSEASKIADAALTNKKGIGAKLETDGNGTVKVGKGSGKVTYDFSTKGNPGHQTVDSMTATEQSALRIAKIVAASRGDVNVKVEAEFGVDENGIDHSNENGYYDRKTNTIHINMSGDNSVLWTLSHEMTHHLANTDTEAYAALRTAIETALKDGKLTTTELEDRGFEYDLDRVDPYIAREGNLWDALVAFEREEHGYGKDAEEEVVARCCESFLGFDQFVKDFARKQYKSAKAINKFIAQMNIDMQRVSEDARQSAVQRNVWNDESPENQILRQLTEIDRIANLWRIAVNAEARKRQAAREETRASTKDSVKRSDAEYLDLARRYESGDKSVEAELRKAVDAAAERAMRDSKIRMPDGKLRRLYHGTYSDEFNVFDKSLIGTAREGDTGFFGKGFYFTFHKGEARMYGRRVIDAYVNITNPFNFETELNTMNGERSMSYNGGRAVFVTNFAEKFHELAKNQSVGTFTKDGKWKEISFAQFAKDFRTVYETVKFNVEEIDGAYGKEWLVTAGEHEESYTNENGETFKWKEYAYQRRYMDERSAHDQAENAYEYLSKTKYEAKLPATAAIIMDTAFSEELIKRNYDGVIQSEDGDEVVAFESSQIKKSDLVVYDDNGNIIPLSERFKTDRTGEDAWKNEDTRYSLKDDVKQKDITEYEHFNEEKYANMSETERIEYREHIAEMQIRKEARERQIAIDRNRRIRRDLTATLKKGNDRIVKLLANPTENAHVPVQLAQAVAEYAQRLNQLLTTSEPKTGEFAGQEKQTQKGALNAQKILDALKRSYADEETIALLKSEDPSFDPRGLIPVQYDENGKMIKDDSLAEMVRGMDEIIQGKHLNELTTDELRYVMNTMRGVIYAVTEANKVTVDGESRNVYRTSRKLANEVSSASKVFGDKKNKLTQFMNRYVIESLGLRRIAKLYSGSDENATFVKMVDDLNEGAIEQERIKQTLRAMFNDVTKKYEKDMKSWYGKDAEWIDTGFGFKITKGMRVSLAMHILNEQNLRNVEKAGLRIPNMSIYKKGNYKEAYNNGKVVRLTKAQAEQIVSHMTEAEKAYFEVAKEFFHKQSGKYINRTSLKLLGFSKAIVDNYFPIQTDDAYRTVKYDDVHQNASVEHPGFLETRKGTANVMYLNDITAVVNRQIDGVAKYAGLAIPMRNWNNVMNAWLFEENENGEWVRSDDGRAHNVLENRMSGEGKSVMKYVDKFVTDLASSGINDTNDVDAAKFAAKLTSNYVKAVLTLNARVALSQLASVPTAAAEIPWKYIVQGFAGNVEGHLNRNASNELIDMYTPIFAMRRAGTQTEVSEVMKRKGLSDKAEQKLPLALGWITAMDTAATRRLWYACERWVKGETNIPVGSDAFYQEVAKRYERVIQNTQPNFTVLQRSPALRSKSAAARIITMFGTQRMQNAGVFIESLAEVVQAKDKATRKAALKKFGRTLSGLITAAIVIGLERALVSALRGRMRPLQDDDKDITVGSVSKYIMGEIGTSLAGSFMYVGELYDFVHGVVGGLTDGDSGYETSFALPAAESLSTMIKFFKDAVPFMLNINAVDEHGNPKYTDHEKWTKTKSFINGLMTAASYATGLPLANASKTILNGTVPLVQDIVESTKTGELNLYLHQSGKLDSANTAANYKEWTNLGKKGSVYLAWENRFKEDKSNGLDHRAELLFEDSALTADEKAILLRMSNSTKDNPLTSKDGVVYKEDGTVAVDFTNLDRYRASTMLSDKQYEGFLNLVDMGVAEDVASTAFIQYNVQKKQGSGANDRFRDWLFATVKNPEDRAKVDMAVVGNTVRVEGTIGYKENGEVYADYSSKEMFDLYKSGKKQQKSDAIISTTDTPEAKAKAFADTDNDYHAKGGIVYNDKDKVVADFTSDEAYRASQMGETHYAKYNDAVKHGMSRENAILAVEKHKEITNDDDKDNATQYATWVFNTYKSANDRAIAGAIYSSKPVTIKDGRTYDENGYIYRDYTSAAWYKLSNRSLSKDGVNKRYEAAKLLEQDGYTAEQTVAAYVEMDKLSKKSEWQKWLKDHGYTNEQINIFLWSRGWAKLQ